MALSTAGRLAHLNVARMRGAIESAEMAEFAAQLEQINALADKSPGFVWRLIDDAGAADILGLGDDMLVNLSVWENLAALRDYVYRSAHAGVMRRRSEWFIPLQEDHLVLWWIPREHLPSMAEAAERLRHLRSHAPTPFAFTFQNNFAASQE